MKGKQRIAVVLGALLVLTGGLVYAQDPFPPISLPDIPSSGNYCLWRINKSFDGTLQAQLGFPYACETGETRHSPTTITFRVLSNNAPTCDEAVPGVPANMFLQATGTTVHRADGLAYFTGTVVLRDGAAGPVLFRGPMELAGRVGTHQILGERCNEITHVEGWIVARGAGALGNLTLRAMVAGKADLPNGLAAEPPSNRITGVIVKAP